jgi:hypothetical protein
VWFQAYDTPAKIIMQVYVALLRAYQPVCKELIRTALDKLTKSLPMRLPEGEQLRVVKWTKKIIVRGWPRRRSLLYPCVSLQRPVPPPPVAHCPHPLSRPHSSSAHGVQLEEGHVLPQLAHVWGLVSRLPQLFTQHQKQFAPQISNSLAKLCLPPSCTFENRELAIGTCRRAMPGPAACCLPLRLLPGLLPPLLSLPPVDSARYATEAASLPLPLLGTCLGACCGACLWLWLWLCRPRAVGHSVGGGLRRGKCPCCYGIPFRHDVPNKHHGNSLDPNGAGARAVS